MIQYCVVQLEVCVFEWLDYKAIARQPIVSNDIDGYKGSSKFFTI